MQDGRNFIFLKERGGGGIAFIKSILSSVSMQFMSLCTMPIRVVNRLEKTQRDFS